MQKLAVITFLALFSLIVILIVSFIAALPTMLLWNWLMPQLFSLKGITFWQALGVNMLAGILFKSAATSAKSS